MEMHPRWQWFIQNYQATCCMCYNVLRPVLGDGYCCVDASGLQAMTHTCAGVQNPYVDGKLWGRYAKAHDPLP